MFAGFAFLLLIPSAVILSPAAAIYLAVKLTSRRSAQSRAGLIGPESAGG